MLSSLGLAGPRAGKGARATPTGWMMHLRDDLSELFEQQLNELE